MGWGRSMAPFEEFVADPGRSGGRGVGGACQVEPDFLICNLCEGAWVVGRGVI